MQSWLVQIEQNRYTHPSLFEPHGTSHDTIIAVCTFVAFVGLRSLLILVDQQVVMYL
jgi:hypothetical protein